MTAATVLNAFTNLRTPIVTGVIGPYSVAGKSRRIFNDAIYLGQVKDGAIMPTSDEPVSLSTLLSQVGAKVAYP